MPRPRQKGRKVSQIAIDRTQDCRVDPATLPADATFKGYETVVVQDLVLQTDNIAFRKEKWYAPSTGRTYLAALPPGYDGAFGPNIKPLSLLLHYATNVSQPQSLALFRQAGTDISHGTLAHWLIHDRISSTPSATNAVREQEADVWDAHTRVAQARRRLHEHVASVHGLQWRLAKARRLLAQTGEEAADLRIASDGRLPHMIAAVHGHHQRVADALGCPLADLDQALDQLDRELVEFR